MEEEKVRRNGGEKHDYRGGKGGTIQAKTASAPLRSLGTLDWDEDLKTHELSREISELMN